MESGFSMLEQDAWGGFLVAYAHMNRIVEDDLQEHFGITHVEFEVLLRLSWAENHRMRIQDLAAQSLLTRSGVTRVVERLEKTGLVTRESAKEDRRGAYAILTKAGVTKFQKSAPAHMEFVKEKFLRFFSDAELKQMAKFWKRLQEG